MSTNTYRDVEINRAEITPAPLYFSRRKFFKLAGTVGVAAALAACGVQPQESTTAPGGEAAPDGEFQPTPDGEALTPYEVITNFNNFYEFTTDKEAVAPMAKDFKIDPYVLDVYGLVNKPIKYSLEEIQSKFTAEERVYRLRCVEGWSMVIPWQGFPLSKILEEVEPTSEAKYIRFETVYDPDQMPGLFSPFYPWPYNEGLRLDEAMHDLAILATGLYEQPLPPQDGAPLRLVVPWKYGFKSIKSIVKIELVAEQPDTLWNTVASNEYGFYANVNPEVDHPRWSQASERRIGETGRRRTLMFNGYGDQVASLYEGMDLRVNY